MKVQRGRLPEETRRQRQPPRPPLRREVHDQPGDRARRLGARRLGRGRQARRPGALAPGVLRRQARDGAGRRHHRGGADGRPERLDPDAAAGLHPADVGRLRPGAAGLVGHLRLGRGARRGRGRPARARQGARLPQAASRRCWRSRTQTQFVVSLTLSGACVPLSPASRRLLPRATAQTLAEEFLACTARQRRGSPDHGEFVEAIRHTLAAGDWPDAARLLAGDLFSLTLEGQEGSMAALFQSYPAGASAEHPELALAHRNAAGAGTAETHRLSCGWLNRRSRAHRLPAGVARGRTCLPAVGARTAQRPVREVVEQVDLLDASTADRSSDVIGMDSEFPPSR